MLKKKKKENKKNPFTLFGAFSVQIATRWKQSPASFSSPTSAWPRAWPPRQQPPRRGGGLPSAGAGGCGAGTAGLLPPRGVLRLPTVNGEVLGLVLLLGRNYCRVNWFNIVCELPKPKLNKE